MTGRWTEGNRKRWFLDQKDTGAGQVRIRFWEGKRIPAIRVVPQSIVLGGAYDGFVRGTLFVKGCLGGRRREREVLNHHIADAKGQHWCKIATCAYRIPNDPDTEPRDDGYNHDQERNGNEKEAEPSIHDKLVALDTPEILGTLREEDADDQRVASPMLWYQPPQNG